MNSTFHPIPWSEFPVECLYYLALMSFVQSVVFIGGSFVILIFFRNPVSTLLSRIGRFGLFLTLFLIVGSLANGVWSCLLWNRVYHSVDYLFDFHPFWPITSSRINETWGNEHGQLLGVTLGQLNLLWFCFASATWGISVILYRLIIRRWKTYDEMQLFQS